MEYNYIFKLSLMGDSGVGKSNIASRFIKNEFTIDSKATIGVEFQTKQIELGTDIIKIQLWDTAGQERYKSIVQSYYRGSVGVILVYDIARYSTFERLSYWLEQINIYCPVGVKIILIGNKMDLVELRQVSYAEGHKFAVKHNLMFMEVSARNGDKIDKSVNLLIDDIYFTICELTNGGERKRKQNLFERVEGNIIIESKDIPQEIKRFTCC
jgi:small GTP-binding protein